MILGKCDGNGTKERYTIRETFLKEHDVFIILSCRHVVITFPNNDTTRDSD